MRHRLTTALMIGIGLLAASPDLASSAWAAIPPEGSAAPALNLTDLDGNPFDSEQVKGRTYVLIFGELYHQPTRQGVAEIDKVLTDPRLAGDTITPILVIAQDASRLDLKTQADSLGLAGLILHDPQRKAFADYRVSVMPTVVVVGPDGKVIYSLAALTARFDDILRDALLVSLGRLSVERFAETLHPSDENSLTEEQIRANRLTQLARQLSRRGLDEMANEKYQEALALWPQSVEARLGLGRLDLHRNRIADAEKQFRAVLAANPHIVEASLGIAYVQTVRGGDELVDAERLVRGVLDRDNSQPRAFYLLGRISEARGKVADAAANYKRAAELLLERQSVE